MTVVICYGNKVSSRVKTVKKVNWTVGERLKIGTFTFDREEIVIRFRRLRGNVIYVNDY